jgi:hypothetical protein
MERNQKQETKTDLKHDSMEFSASTDGDDILDDHNSLFDDEEEISSKELNELNGVGDFEMAAALNAVETDRLADVDNLPEESDEDDYYDNDEEEEDDDMII